MAAFYIDARSGELLGPVLGTGTEALGEPAPPSDAYIATSKLPFGCTGKLKWEKDEQETGPDEWHLWNRFLTGFEPTGAPPLGAEALWEATNDPFARGLILAWGGAAGKLRPKVEQLQLGPKEAERLSYALLVAGKPDELEDLRHRNVLHEPDPLYDIELSSRLLHGGIDELFHSDLARPGAQPDRYRSVLHALAPAMRQWKERGGTPEVTALLVHQLLRAPGLSGKIGIYAPGRIEWFADGSWDAYSWGQVLTAAAPDFVKFLSNTIYDSTKVNNAWVLGPSQSGHARHGVGFLWSDSGQVQLQVLRTLEATDTFEWRFGAPAEILFGSSWGGALEAARETGAPEPAEAIAMLETAMQKNPTSYWLVNPALGYLALAADRGIAGYTWERWRAQFRNAIPQGASAEAVLRVCTSKRTAEELTTLFPEEVKARKQNLDTEAVWIAGILLRDGNAERARAIVNLLPDDLRKDADYSWKAMHVFVDLVTGRLPPQPLKGYAGPWIDPYGITGRFEGLDPAVYAGWREKLEPYRKP
jgi:hypothetical protein